MNKIAQSMGYSGDMGQFQDFIEQDPARQARMKMFEDAAMQMAKGGVVKMQQGGGVQRVAEPMMGPIRTPEANTPAAQTQDAAKNVQEGWGTYKCAGGAKHA